MWERLFNPIRIFLGAGVILAMSSAGSLAQNWNVRTPAQPVVPGEAIVVGISRDLQIVTLKYYTNLIANQYKITSCYFDDDSELEKDGQPVLISQLREGDVVEVEAKVFNDGNRSCGIIQIKTPPAKSGSGSPKTEGQGM